MSSKTDLAIANLFQITVPPLNPVRNQPARKIVFVDPDDDNASFFWPAMVIPFDDIPEFQLASGASVDIPGKGECLVAYFEDGSFSVVSDDDVIPFCPYEQPYTSYASGQNSSKFCSDKGVILATAYWQKAIVPPSFTWLKSENIIALNQLRLERNGENQEEILNLQAEGQGIFGFEQRRISRPPSRQSEEPNANRKDRASNPPSATRKPKPERKVTVKKEKKKIKTDHRSSLPNSKGKHAATALIRQYTKTEGCDKCYPVLSKEDESPNTRLKQRILCFECDRLLDTAFAPMYKYYDPVMQKVLSLGPHCKLNAPTFQSNIVRLLHRLDCEFLIVTS